MKAFIDTLKDHPLFSIAFFAVLAFQIIGMVIGLFTDDQPYDKLVHFLLPALGAALLFALLVRYGVLRPLPVAGVILTVFLYGTAIEALWEIVEFTLDNTAGTNLQETVESTIQDIIASSTGSFLAAILFALSGGEEVQK